MATKKKTTVRRIPRSATPRTFSEGQPVAPVAGADNAVATQPAVRSSSAGAGGVADARRRTAARSEVRPQLPLSEEYAYVVGDLRRLGILAAAMLGVLVVLGLVIH